MRKGILLGVALLLVGCVAVLHVGAAWGHWLVSNRWEDATYVSREAWDELIDTIAERDSVLDLPGAREAAATLKRRAAGAAYRLEPATDGDGPEA